MPFTEAIDFLKSKVPMTKAEWAALEKKLRFRAFTVAKLGTAEEIDKAKQVLIKSLENGESYAESWEALKQKVNTNALGIKPGYWETVFRTNTQSAYMAGKLQKYEGTGAVAYQLLVIEDERTSKICRHLLVESGYGAILPVGHRFWQKYGFPPYHFNCRTSVNPIYSSQVAKTGYIVEDIPMNRFTKFKPQKGFGGNPLDRGNWWDMTDSMQKQAVKFGLMNEFNEERISLFSKNTNERKISKMSEFIDSKYDGNIPDIKVLVKDSNSKFATMKEFRMDKKFKPIVEAIDFLNLNYPEASFSRFVWASSSIIEDDAIAMFSPKYMDTLFLNNVHSDFNYIEILTAIKYQTKTISTASPIHCVLHESAHKWIRIHNIDTKYFFVWDWKNLDDENFMLENISENAARSPSEAMAELFVLKMLGKEIPEAAIDVISKYSRKFAKCLNL